MWLYVTGCRVCDDVSRPHCLQNIRTNCLTTQYHSPWYMNLSNTTVKALNLAVQTFITREMLSFYNLTTYFMVQNNLNMHSVVFLRVAKLLRIQSEYTNQQQQCLQKKNCNFWNRLIIKLLQTLIHMTTCASQLVHHPYSTAWPTNNSVKHDPLKYVINFSQNYLVHRV